MPIPEFVFCYIRGVYFFFQLNTGFDSRLFQIKTIKREFMQPTIINNTILSTKLNRNVAIRINYNEMQENYQMKLHHKYPK